MRLVILMHTLLCVFVFIVMMATAPTGINRLILVGFMLMTAGVLWTANTTLRAMSPQRRDP